MRAFAAVFGAAAAAARINKSRSVQRLTQVLWDNGLDPASRVQPGLTNGRKLICQGQLPTSHFCQIL